MTSQDYPSPEPVDSRENGPFYESVHQTNMETGAPDQAEGRHRDRKSQERPVAGSAAEQQRSEYDRLRAELQHHMDPLQPTDMEMQYTSASETPQATLVGNQPQRMAQEALLSQFRGTPPSQVSDINSPQPRTMNGPMSMQISLAPTNSRPKVSRACDECRRKKIRCDAVDETEAPCTACRKAALPCFFARQHQKRGPPKGYIKQLNDRVSGLEAQLKYPLGGPIPPETEADSSYASENNIRGRATSNKRKHGVADGSNHQYEPNINATFHPVFTHSAITHGLDERLADLYYQRIHPCLPFLPLSGVPELRQLVTAVPETTRHAFLAAFELAMRPSDDIPESSHERADQLLRTSIYKDPAGLPILQSLLLLSISAANRGLLVMQQGHGPRPGHFLAEAMNRAEDLDLYNRDVLKRNMDKNALPLARSIALSLATLHILDKLANMRSGSTPGITSGLTMLGDKDLVSTRVFWISTFCVHLTDLFNLNLVNLDSNMNDGMRATLTYAKRTFTSSMTVFGNLSNVEKDPILELMYWYALGQMQFYLWPLMERQELFHVVRRIVELLGTGGLAVNPLTHHFAGFATHILFQLTDFHDTREEADALLETLGTNLNNMVPDTDSQSFNAAIRDTVARRRADLNESQDASNNDSNDGGIAAAAAAAAKAVHQIMGSASFDPGLLNRGGYLHALLG